MFSHVFTAYEPVYAEIAQISQFENNCNEKLKLLHVFEQRLTRVQETLPFLKKECTNVLAEAHLAHIKLHSELLKLNLYKQRLNRVIDALLANNKKLTDNQNKKNALMADRKQLIQAFIHNEALLQKKGELVFAKIGTKKAAESACYGLGLDILDVETKSMDDQASFLEIKIAHQDKKVETLAKLHKLLDRDALQQLEDLKPAIENIKQTFIELYKQISELNNQVDEMEALVQVSQMNTLHSAALLGDVEQIKKQLLRSNATNTPNIYGFKPVYYAFRVGHLAAALLLLDLTPLTDSEHQVIVNKLPRGDQMVHDALAAALDAKLLAQTIKNELNQDKKYIKINTPSFLSFIKSSFGMSGASNEASLESNVKSERPLQPM